MAVAIAPTRLQRLRTKDDLADEINVPLGLLTRRAFEIDQWRLYSVSQHRKRSGGERTIHAPHWPLANIQRKLLGLLEELYRPPSRAMGFIKGRGIKQNASFHVGKRLILNVDIENFFPSIHFGRVRGRLLSKPYQLTNDIATTIARLCTLDGVLPIGAPTSPILANMVISSLDAELTAFARQHGCFYTRYADDLTFSTNRRSFPQAMVRRNDDVVSGVEVGPELNDIISKAGFKLQATKTRLMDNNTRKEVCGVTCNERLNVRRTHLRDVRGAIHAWRKFGREAAEITWREKYNWRDSLSLERSIRGKIEHIIHIRGRNDKTASQLVEQFNALPDRLFKDIDYDYSEQNPMDIINSVCLIECENDDILEYPQGTGFILPSGSVITNYHVISFSKKEDGIVNELFKDIFITLEGESIRHEFVVTHHDITKDVAILTPKYPEWNIVFAKRGCQLSFQEPTQGTAISLVGYPIHTPGGSCKFVPGHVTGNSMFDGNKYFNISPPIVKGNSGGPVIDRYGQVVGITTRGVDSEDVANLTSNGCISIHSIDRLVLSS